MEKSAEKKKDVEKSNNIAERTKKSKFTLYWESGREPGFEIVDMRTVLR